MPIPYNTTKGVAVRICSMDKKPRVSLFYVYLLRDSLLITYINLR